MEIKRKKEVISFAMVHEELWKFSESLRLLLFMVHMNGFMGLSEYSHQDNKIKMQGRRTPRISSGRERNRDAEGV